MKKLNKVLSVLPSVLKLVPTDWPSLLRFSVFLAVILGASYFLKFL